jgi:hypothetical protein
MPSEHESADKARRLLSRLSAGACAQQCEQCDARQQSVGDYVRTTMDVTTRCHYVHRQSDHQQAGRGDVPGLKGPVAWPKPRAHCSAGRHGKKDQREQRQYPGIFVTGSGQLDVLNDPVIHAEQQPDVENRGGERQPAEKLVTAQRERTGGARPRPNGQHAEDEATRDRAQAQGLRDLPRCR